MTIRRRGLSAAAAGLALAVVVPGGIALADAAGPTDFKTEIVSVSPATPQIRIGIVGGDSFVVLSVEPGTTVELSGYRGEPYLAFDADGTVRENEIAPTTIANRERFGQEPTPTTDVDPATVAPQWRVVATDGEYAWHDHRAHWMVPKPPPDAVRGEVFDTSSLELVVDGVAVTVQFEYRWMTSPSPAPFVAGLVAGVFAALIALSTRRPVALAVVAGAGAAAALGWWQFRSLPPSTAPLATWWLLPAVAAAAALAAALLRRSLVGKALLLLAGIQLAVWVYLRRDGLGRAVLPTDAPFWLDRGISGAALAVAVVAIVAGGVTLFRLSPADDDEAASASRPSPSTTVTTWGRKH